MSSHSSPTKPEGGATVVRRGSYDDEAESLSTAILLELESLPGFDAEASADVLYSSVDPDALEALFRSAADADRADGWVTFPVETHEVSVSASGDIVICTQPP